MSPDRPEVFRLAGCRVWVAGHEGMVGSALMRRLAHEPVQLVTVPRARLDLTRQAEVEAWMEVVRPDVVILAAARVGGILANDRRPVDFLADNLLIQTNVIATARRVGVRKLLFLGSSCIYPRDSAQPIGEDQLLAGPLEPTNQWYAIAKIAGLKLCAAYRRQHGCDFIGAMPTNLYGPNDRFDPAAAHVIPALIRRMDDARRGGAGCVAVWGSGRPRREFLHVDDLADACVHLLRHYSDEAPINVGCGRDIAIADLAALIAETVGFEGALAFDPALPDGTPAKRLDVSRLTALGWQPRIGLREGLRQTYAWYGRERAGTREDDPG